METIDIFFRNEDDTQELIGAMSEIRPSESVADHKNHPSFYVPYTRFDRNLIHKVFTHDTYIHPSTQKMPFQIIINKATPAKINNAWVEDSGFAYIWENWILVTGIVLVAENIEGPIF